jgi:hypothetical protein
VRTTNCAEVDRVRALAEDLPLRAALAAAREEAAHVLEVAGARVLGERLIRTQRPPVAREDVADLALRDRHQRNAVDAVHERDEQVPAAAQDLRLEAGFAVQRDQARLDGSARAEPLLHDPDARVRDEADRLEKDGDDENRQRYPADRRERDRLEDCHGPPVSRSA